MAEQIIDLSSSPTNSAIVLRPVNVSDGVAAQIPEGQMVVVDTAALFGAPSASRGPLPAATSVASGTAASAMVNTNAALTRWGFSGAAAGENSIGLIGIPRWWTPGARPPEGIHSWGHTAHFAKVNGRIKIVRGFVPKSIVEAALRGGAIKAGEDAVGAAISNDLMLFANTGARTIEWPVTAEMAVRVSNQLPPTGLPPAEGPQLYTGRQAFYRGPGNAGNCVNWACEQVEAALGGRVGYAKPGGGTTPVVEPVNAKSGLQGEFMKFTKAAAEDGRVVGTMPGATGDAVVASMPRYMRFLKIGGRVMIVIGAGMVVYETYRAAPGQQLRTFVTEGSGFAGSIGGGILGGMAAGAVCGPGVLACSIVFGMAGGLIGYYVASEGAGAIYDYAAEDKLLPAKPIKVDPKAKPPWNQDPRNPWPDGTPGNNKSARLAAGGVGANVPLSKEAKAIYDVLPASGQRMTAARVLEKLRGRYNSVDLGLAWEELGKAGKANLEYDRSSGGNVLKVIALSRVVGTPHNPTRD